MERVNAAKSLSSPQQGNNVPFSQFQEHVLE